MRYEVMYSCVSVCLTYIVQYEFEMSVRHALQLLHEMMSWVLALSESETKTVNSF